MRGGIRAQDLLCSDLAAGLLALHAPDPSEQVRMRVLMRPYHDTPMDLADASLVSAAETLGVQRIFSIDRHFRAYRIPRSRSCRSPSDTGATAR